MTLGQLQKGRLLYEDNMGSVGTITPGTSVTTGGAAGTKGSYASCIASTSFDAYMILVRASGYALSATGSRCCLDIAVGGATEEIIIPDLLAGYCGDPNAQHTTPKAWMFPLYIPAGSAISARAAGSRVSTAFRVGICLWGGDAIPPFRVGRKVTTYGVGAVPAGTDVVPGASGAEGSFTQIVASTSEEHFAVMPSVQISNDTTTNLRLLTCDIGVGAATEETLLQTWWYHTGGNEDMSGPVPCMPAFADIPSGTRMAMRLSNSGTNDGGYDAAIHAVS